MHWTAANIAQPEPLYNVVLLLMMKITAVPISKPMAKIVTAQIVIFGKNRESSITNKLRPTDIRTPQSKNSIAFWEFHLS